MPIHFLWGDEDFLIERAVDKIKQKALGDDINELNFKRVDNPSFALFSELLRTNAMMFGDIVIQIKCSKYFLETKTKEKLNEKEVKELVEGLNSVSDRVHLILICETPRGEKKKPDSRKKLYKELIKLTKPEEFPSYRSYEEYKLIPIVKKMAQEIDLKINQNEISLLIQTTGSSLRDIFSQLEKLKLLSYPSNTVTPSMVKEISTNTPDIYCVFDYVLKKDYVNALNEISNILQKEHYLSSLSFMQTTISNLVKIKIYASSMSTFDLGIKLNLHEFLVKKNLEKIRNVDLAELVRLKINLADMEHKLKTNTLKDPICAYEMAFIKDSV